MYQGALALFVSSQVYWRVEAAWQDIPLAVLVHYQEHKGVVVEFRKVVAA